VWERHLRAVAEEIEARRRREGAEDG
jgi:hypothetical protein